MKKTAITKNVLEAFDWSQLENPQSVESWAKSNYILAKPWALEQMLAHISRWPLVYKDNKIDGAATVMNAVRSSEMNRGIWLLATTRNRGTIVKAQSSVGLPYSALVPLILAAFKKYKSIEYTQWTNTKYCFDPKLQEAINTELELWEACQNLGSTALQEVLNCGLVYKSGEKAGELRNPMTTYKIYGDSGTIVDELSDLAKVMLLQFWIAHPQNRNKYMILDPHNWDLMPESRIAGDFGLGSKNKIKENYEIELPWEV